MDKYNLSKSSKVVAKKTNKEIDKDKSAITIEEKRNQEHNKKFNLKAIKNTGNYEWQLEDDRKQPTGDRIYEKLLSDVRVGSSNIITDKQLDKRDSYIKHRNNIDVLSSEQGNPTEKERAKAYHRANFADDHDTAFWDKWVGVQIPEYDFTRISDNKQYSQLVENYDDRKEFRKSTNEIITSLKEADAMLFHIYRTAATEHRDLTETENKMVNDITYAKMEILAAIEDKRLGETEAEEAVAEKSDITAERYINEDDLLDFAKKDDDDVCYCEDCGCEILHSTSEQNKGKCADCAEKACMSPCMSPCMSSSKSNIKIAKLSMYAIQNKDFQYWTDRGDKWTSLHNARLYKSSEEAQRAIDIGIADGQMAPILEPKVVKFEYKL